MERMNNFEIQKTEPGLMGVSVIKGGIRIQVELSAQKSCGILLYQKNIENNPIRIDFTEDIKFGDVYVCTLKNCNPDRYNYLFHKDGVPIMDQYARKVNKHKFFGKEHESAGKSDVTDRCEFVKNSFAWGDDHSPSNSYTESIYYGMHIRGFTQDTYSGVREKGTFAGVQKKIPYLKDLGITGIVVQPLYETEECEFQIQAKTMEEAAQRYTYHKTSHINYWGYQKGFYYAPKNSYSFQEDSVKELKTLVKTLHHNDLEIIMQVYFFPDMTYAQIYHVLEYWTLYYHIDGFQILGTNIPVLSLAANPFLHHIKLWYDNVPLQDYYKQSDQTAQLGELNRTFEERARCFLKGDENSMQGFVERMNYHSANKGIINELAFYSGFRLYDVVSYERKHNQANGEDNQDGENYNFSWNCGEEGIAKKRSIILLRHKLIKNALCFLFLAKGTPLIFMGDECGKTSQGNNNPYCQDNETTWKQWKLRKKEKELLQFTKNMILLRKNHPIISQKSGNLNNDTKKCGYPEISYHGKDVWKPDFSYYVRHIGILICGTYSKIESHSDNSFYMLFNMHWETHKFAMPKLPDGSKWRMIINTDSGYFETLFSESESPKELVEMEIVVPARSVLIFQSYKEKKKKEHTILQKETKNVNKGKEEVF